MTKRFGKYKSRRSKKNEGGSIESQARYVATKLPTVIEAKEDFQEISQKVSKTKNWLDSLNFDLGSNVGGSLFHSHFDNLEYGLSDHGHKMIKKAAHHVLGGVNKHIMGHHKGQNMYKNNVIYLNQFKTDKQFAKRGLLPLKFTPSRKLKSLLTKFIYIRSLQKEIDHDYLIVNRSWRPFERNTFYKYLSGITYKYAGKRLGSSMLRKIYITEFLAKNPSLQERKKFLYGMQQLQLETQMSYGRINLPE